ncbi:hypothetical protein [Ekhidna sp.]
MLKINYKNPDLTIWINNGKKFRMLVGVNGMLLPLMLWLFLYIDSGQTEVLVSISHYYFTRANSIFIGIMSAISVFLIVYKGEETQDFLISVGSGLAAICVILFPTDNLMGYACDEPCSHIITNVNPSSVRVGFHYISAAIFLLGLAYMSGFLFVKSDKQKNSRGKKKVIRNRIYRICSGIMFLAIGVIFFLGFLKWMPAQLYDDLKITYWMEVLAVESFGISWLVKGEAIFGD